MRPPRLFVRRVVVDPLWVPAAAALAVLLMLVATAGVVAAPLATKRRLSRLAVFGALYLLVDAAIVVSCLALWLRYRHRRRRGRAWADAHAVLMRRALGTLVSASCLLLGFRMQVEQLPAQESLAGRPMLVLARHGGPGDSFAIAQLLLSRCGRTPAIVAKESLRWDPGLDVLLSRLSACFLPTRGAGRQLAARIAALAARLDSRDAILLFPEGGNWTPGRHRYALARLWVRGRRVAAARAAANRHVLPPRPAGVLACLEARPELEVVVVAHTGLDDLVSPADIWRALPVRGRPLITRWWHLPATEVPIDADLRQDWLDVQWAVVDSWIDARKARLRAAEPAPLVTAAVVPAADAVVPAADAVVPAADAG